MLQGFGIQVAPSEGPPEAVVEEEEMSFFGRFQTFDPAHVELLLDLHSTVRGTWTAVSLDLWQ